MTRRSAGLAVFFLLAFAVPWTGWTILAVTGMDWGSPTGRLLFSTGLACSLGGLVAVAVEEGRAGLVERLRQLVRWRVSPGWYAFALLGPLALVWIASTLYLLATRGAYVAPDLSALRNWWSMAALLIIIPGPLGEEFGWRGYLLPRLTKRFSFTVAAVLVGLLWGVWHLPLYWGRIVGAGPLWFALFCAGVVALSILIAVLWLETRSLLLPIAAHFMVNLSQNWTFYPSLRPDEQVAYLAVFVGVTAAAAVAALYRVRGRPPPPPSSRQLPDGRP